MEIQITARKMTGAEVATVPMLPSGTVLDLKTVIASAAKIPVLNQRLLSGTTVLLNNTKLGEVFPAAEAVDITLVLVDKWAQEVSEDWRRLRKAPEDLRNDPQVVREAMANSQGEALKFAGSRAREAKDIVLEAMQYNVALAQYADPALGDDVDFMLAAGELLVRATPDQISAAGLQRWGWQKQPALCENRNFVLAMATVSGDSALRAATPYLCRDREVVLTAVRRSGSALQFADSELQADVEVVREAVRTTPSALKHAAMELRADREMAMFALQQPRQPYFGSLPLLDCVAPQFQQDREIVTMALNRRGADLEFVGSELKGDKEILAMAINQDLHAAQHFPKAWQLDHDFILPLVRERPLLFKSLGEAAKADRAVALEVVKKQGRLLEFASEELRGDMQVVLEAVRSDPNAVKFAKYPADESTEVALLVVKKDWRLFANLPPKLKTDRVVAMAALRQKGDVQNKALQKMSLTVMVEKLCEPKYK